AVVVALVGPDGAPALPPVYVTASSDREPADPARAARMLLRLREDGVLRDDGADVSAPYLVSPTGLPSVVVAAPASRGAEGVDLWLAAELRLDVLSEILDQAAPDLAFALLDAEGEVLAGADHALVEPRLLGALAGASARFEYDLD